jgi:hypothetical protein
MRTPSRILLFVSCFLALSAALAGEPIETASRLASGGAPQLALAHVEQNQPAREDLPQWLPWEALRLDLLGELHLYQEVLARVAELPPDLPPEFLQRARLRAAEAALALGQSEKARDYLSRLLWQSELAPEQYKAVRWLVIKSYLDEKRAADAYPLMLRYSQEFSPLSPAEAATFIGGLLEQGAAAEAVAWLLTLKPGSPLRLLVELKSGLTTPGQAVAAARVALNPAPQTGKKSSGRSKAKGAGAAPRALSPAEIGGYWTVILHAAALERDSLLLAEAREQLLNLRELPEGSLSAVSPEDLWQSYSALAEEQANRASLLQGDDMAWFVLADSQAKASPLTARSLFAYLAAQARDDQVRANAQSRLLGSLTEANLGLTAVRLFSENGHFTEANGLSSQARVLLGELAQRNGRPDRAAAYWHGLDAPPEGWGGDDWQLTRARVFAAAGADADLGDAVRLFLAAKTAASADQVKAVLDMAQGLEETDKIALARELLGRVLPLAGPAEQRTILFRLGQLAEHGKDGRAAADYYLQAAVLEDQMDALASQARYRAARELARADLREDAKRQYQLLLKGSREANIQAAARRALARLP